MDQVIEKLQNADTIMEVTDLCKFFKAGRKQTLKAVDTSVCLSSAVKHWVW